jgi:hypothetical protein
MRGTKVSVVHFALRRTDEAMTDIHEKELADQIDREVASSDGLMALVLCLSVAAGLVVASVAALLGAF